MPTSSSEPGVFDDAAAARLDAADPLGRFRDEFVVADPDLVYLDGNSLGRAPRRSVAAVRRALDRWATDLVAAWDGWFDLGAETGARLAPLLGARPGTTVVGDQTTVNLYKLAVAALRAVGRGDVITDEGNFPSDRYVLAAAAEAAGGALRVLPADPDPDAVGDALDDRVGLVSLSHVSYRSGALLDMDSITARAHAAGALVLWDLSHSVGVVPIDLEGAGVDLAVGCTYKYLNGGPGAPAFLYARQAERLINPVPGWFGHREPFAFSSIYDPAPDARRFLVGTPPILALVAVAEGVALVAEAGIDAIRAKSIAMTSAFIAAAAERLVPLGFEIVTPRDAERRGSHVALRHAEAWKASRALRRRRVIVDFRAPDVVRYGFAPLYGTFSEIWRAVEVTAEVVRSSAHLDEAPQRHGVT